MDASLRDCQLTSYHSPLLYLKCLMLRPWSYALPSLGALLVYKEANLMGVKGRSA